MSTRTLASTPALLGRLSWMLVGPFALAVIALSIAEWRDGWASPTDWLYFAVLGGMLLGRWVEFRYGRPLTATGEPADAAHFRRYALLLGALGLGGWLAANLVGNQALRGSG